MCGELNYKVKYERQPNYRRKQKEVYKMKKSDLENGMIVEARDGCKYIVIKDFTEKTCDDYGYNDILLEINGNGFMPLDTYKDDLLRPDRDSIAINYDIMKVYYIERLGNPKLGLVLLWERKNDLKIIEQQINKIKKYFRIERTSLKEKEDEYEIDVILENGEETIIYIDDEILKNGDNFVFNTIMISINVTIMNRHCDKVLL